MAEHDPLGDAGCTRRIRQHGDVGRRVEAHLGGRAALGQQPPQVRVPRRGLVRAVEHDEVVVGDADRLRGGLRLRQQRAHGDEPGGRGIRQLLLDLTGRVERVQRRDGRARAQDAVEHRRERRNVRAQQTDDGVGAHPAGREGAGERVDLRLEGAVRRLRARRGVDQRDAGGVFGGQTAEQVVVDARRGDLDIGERAGEHGWSPSTTRFRRRCRVPPSSQPCGLGSTVDGTESAGCARRLPCEPSQTLTADASRRRDAARCSAASSGVMPCAAASSNRDRTASPIPATRSMISALVPRCFASRSR